MNADPTADLGGDGPDPVVVFAGIGWPGWRWPEVAGEAVRAWNHATRTTGGYEWPGDVAMALAGVKTVVERVPQGLDQTVAWLRDGAAGGAFYAVPSDQGEPVEVVAELAVAVEAAVRALRAAVVDLDRATGLAARLGGFP